MHSVTSPDNVIKLDPSYYSYASCFCKEGFYEEKQYEDGLLVSIKCVEPKVNCLAGWDLLTRWQVYEQLSASGQLHT
jgi:hypothetical protein